MLQIISGKFYTSKDRHTSDGYGILYSNYSWVAPLPTCIGTIDPCDKTGSIVSYVFRYTNQLERDETWSPQLVRTGDGEIVEQFRLIASFGLNCYFNLEKDAVVAHCRTTRRSYADDFVPSKFVARSLNSRIDGTYEETQDFLVFVDRIIGLSRNDYKSVLAFISNYVHALEAVSFNLDLAYSMLVYCLESLVKRFGEKYNPDWCDYDEGSRKLVDKALKEIANNTADQVRSAILTGTNLRLRKQYLEFCSKHVSNEYFNSAPPGTVRPLRRSQLEVVLNNTYKARSGYVHELRQIRQQLRNNLVAQDDVFVWENDPHLTFRGLARLTRHIALSIINSLPQLPIEELDWRGELPGTIQMEWAPEYWVGRTEGFTSAQARQRLSGFLVSLQGCFVEGAAILDVRSLLGIIERTLHQSSREDTPAMVALYVLFNANVSIDHQIPKWEVTISRFESVLNDCSIESMITHLLVSAEWPWDAATTATAYQEYSRRRFKASALTVPALLDAALLCRIGASYLDAGDRQSFESWLDRASLEMPSLPGVQKMILYHRKNGFAIPVSLFWQVAREGWTDPPVPIEVTTGVDPNPLSSDAARPSEDSAKRAEAVDAFKIPLPNSAESSPVGETGSTASGAESCD